MTLSVNASVVPMCPKCNHNVLAFNYGTCSVICDSCRATFPIELRNILFPLGLFAQFFQPVPVPAGSCSGPRPEPNYCAECGDDISAIIHHLDDDDSAGHKFVPRAAPAVPFSLPLKHTPLPWHQGGVNKEELLSPHTIFGQDGAAIAQFFGMPLHVKLSEVDMDRYTEGIGNIRLVIAAVNSHEELKRQRDEERMKAAAECLRLIRIAESAEQQNAELLKALEEMRSIGRETLKSKSPFSVMQALRQVLTIADAAIAKYKRGDRQANNRAEQVEALARKICEALALTKSNNKWMSIVGDILRGQQ